MAKQLNSLSRVRLLGYSQDRRKKRKEEEKNKKRGYTFIKRW